MYYEDGFNKYGVTHVMSYRNSKLTMLLTKDTDNYKMLYKDDHFVFFERLNVKTENEE